MNAVVTPTRPKARKASPSPAPATPAALDEHTAAGCVNAFAVVSEMLECAWRADEANLACGDSTRLLRLAFNMADEVCVQQPFIANGQGVAYDIAALVKASRRVPGDTNSTEREEFLTIAGQHLAWLTKDEDVMADWSPESGAKAKAPAAPAPNQDTFASLAYYCSREAEAVLRTVAEDGTNAPESEALWGVMTICGILLNDMDRFHLQPTLGACEDVLCYMDQAIGILSFFDGDLVVDAGGRLLCMARDTLVAGMEGLSYA